MNRATGEVLAERTVRAKRRSFEDLLQWARRLGGERVWALEDCRHVSGALERFLLARGERVVRVAPKLTAGARDSARERGKSDAIDAVAIARAAIRHGIETLPVAQLAGVELDIRLLVDHRERLVATRTRLINDLRWHLHDLWPELEIPTGGLIAVHWPERLAGRLARTEQTARVRIARDELRRIRELTRTINALEHELALLVAQAAPAAARRTRLRRPDRRQTRRRDRRHSAASRPTRSSHGSPDQPRSPPPPARTIRYRLDRGGNRQINSALHRLALCKGLHDPDTAAYLARKQAEGKTRREALRCLKRHLARRVWHLLQPPDTPPQRPPRRGHHPLQHPLQQLLLDIGAHAKAGLRDAWP